MPPKAIEAEPAPLAELVEAWSSQLDSVPPVPPAALTQGLHVAAWRALGAALAADPAKAPAAAIAALEAAQTASRLSAPEVGPVGEREVVDALQRAVRRGLESDDPRRVAEALALWRAERALVDPEGAGAAGEAESAALRAELEAAGARALAQAEAMLAAGEVGR